MSPLPYSRTLSEVYGPEQMKYPPARGACVPFLRVRRGTNTATESGRLNEVVIVQQYT